MGRSQSELLDGVPPMGRGRAAMGYRLRITKNEVD